MAIAYDSSAMQSLTDSASSQVQTYSFTVGAGSNRLLFVILQYALGANPGSTAVTGVTYNGVAMSYYWGTPLIGDAGGANYFYDFYYLVAPSTGANNIVVTFDNTHNTFIGAMIVGSYSGVLQTFPFEQNAGQAAVLHTSNLSVTTLQGSSITTTHDNAWIISHYKNDNDTTFVQNVGTLRVQGEAGVSGRHYALVDRGPLTPTGSYSTTLDTSGTDNMNCFSVSMIAANAAALVQYNAGTEGTLVIAPNRGTVVNATIDATAITAARSYVLFNQAGSVVIQTAHARATAQVAANTNVLTFTVGAADATFQVMANVLVTTSTTHNFTVTVDYTDESNTSRTLTLPFAQLAGTIITAITNTTGAGPYEGVPVTIRAKAATTVVFKTAGTFTTVTYNIDASVMQVA